MWRPIALSHEAPAGSAAPVIADGREIVVWRSESGVVSVWEDRCPHRGMRLSFGFVRGETLACLYHGWRYGTDAGCRSIPAHPDLTPPASLCAAAYPVAEAGGLVWAAPDGAAAGPPPAPPAGFAPVRSLTASVPEARVAAALAGWEAAGPGLRVGAAEGLPLAVAFRARDAGATTLHVLSGGDRAAASHWAEGFRDALECGRP